MINLYLILFILYTGIMSCSFCYISGEEKKFLIIIGYLLLSLLWPIFLVIRVTGIFIKWLWIDGYGSIKIG